MNCLDCQTDPPGPWPFGIGPRPAVAVCLDCGAGLCEVHAVITTEAAAEPPARRIRCRQCDAAKRARRQVVGDMAVQPEAKLS